MVATFPVMIVAAFLPQADPMIELKAVYPYADPLCTAVSADGTLGFVAEGAGISVIKLNGSCTGVVPRTPLDASIWAIEPYGDQDKLFIAGGTMGLFELSTCPELSQNCTACAGWVGGSPAPLDTAGERVCIDVAVDGPNDRLYALFSADDDTQVREYDIASTPTWVRTTGQPSGIGGRGYAIVVDPTDGNHVYVAMGEGGFARVDFSPTTPTWAQGPILNELDQLTDCGGVGHPASVRDLSIAVIGSGVNQHRFLYAAADLVGVVEIELGVTTNPWSPTMTYWDQQLTGSCTDPVGFEWGYRVSTVTDGGQNVLIAIAGNTLPGEFYELGPSTSLGHWEADLGTHPDCTLGAARLPRLYLYTRRGSTPTYKNSFVTQSNGDPAPWRSLTVRKRNSSYIAYEGRTDGLHVFSLGDPFSLSFSTPYSVFSYVGKGAAHLDGVASFRNPDVLYFGNDRLGGELVGMIQVDNTDQLIPIEGTNGLCESSGLELECNSYTPVELDCGIMEQPNCVSLFEPPNPFMNGLLGQAHWEGPNSREWFVAGSGNVVRQVGCTAVEECPPECNEIANPCSYTDAWCPEDNPCNNDRSIWDHPSFPEPDQPGWLFVQMNPGTQGSPVTRASLLTRWWQMESPDDASLDGNDDFGRNYFNSANDVREASDLVHLFRSGTRQGYVLVDRSQVMDLAIPAVVCPANGRGQFLELEDVDEVAVTTHFEIPTGHPSGTGAHTVRGSSFQIESEEGTQYLVGIAAGSVVKDLELSNDWYDYMTRPMAVFYDATNADPQSSTPPELAAIALGDEDDGFAVAVCTMTDGEGHTYAFVADLMGRVWTFDVSASELDPNTATDPDHALPVVGVWPVPPRAFDGRVPNILDMEIDGHLLYLANTSRGVTILDASSIDPNDPEGAAGLREIPCSPIDTPGLAEGIALRVEYPPNEDPITTIVVGDTRGGMRLYGRQECTEE